jgi:hypothetical protein
MKLDCKPSDLAHFINTTFKRHALEVTQSSISTRILPPTDAQVEELITEVIERHILYVERPKAPQDFNTEEKL